MTQRRTVQLVLSLVVAGGLFWVAARHVDVAQLAVAGASRLLEREIDPKAHADLIDKLAREIEGAKAGRPRRPGQE